MGTRDGVVRTFGEVGIMHGTRTQRVAVRTMNLLGRTKLVVFLQVTESHLASTHWALDNLETTVFDVG